MRNSDRQYVWGVRYADDLVLRDRFAGTTDRLYALADYFQTTALADTSGAVQERYVYKAFGGVNYYSGSYVSRSTSSYAWTYLYGGYQYDLETLLYQVRNRYYHSSLGRWLSRDPIGEGAGTNLFAYVLNNAVNGVDPLGLEDEIDKSKDCCLKKLRAGVMLTVELLSVGQIPSGPGIQSAGDQLKSDPGKTPEPKGPGDKTPPVNPKDPTDPRNQKNPSRNEDTNVPFPSPVDPSPNPAINDDPFSFTSEGAGKIGEVDTTFNSSLTLNQQRELFGDASGSASLNNFMFGLSIGVGSSGRIDNYGVKGTVPISNIASVTGAYSRDDANNKSTIQMGLSVPAGPGNVSVNFSGSSGGGNTSGQITGGFSLKF